MDRLLLTQSFRLSLRHPLQSQHSLPQLRRPLRVVVIHRHLIIVFLKNATFERPFHSIPSTTVSDSTNGDSLVARGGVNNGKRNARQRHRSPTPDSHRAARNRSASPAAQSHPPRRRRPSPTHVNDISNSAAATGSFDDLVAAGGGVGFSVPTTASANLRLVAVHNVLLQSITTENQLLRDAATARDAREREHELRDRARYDDVSRLRATLQTVSRAAGL